MKRVLLIALILPLVFSQDALASGGLPSPGAEASGSRAIIRNGLAIPPRKAPARIKRAIAAGNAIAKKPYRWGGGHSLWRGGIKRYIARQGGFDCSGSISFVLGKWGGGWLKSPLTSVGFMNRGRAGRGKWITVITSTSHAYLKIAGLRFDTSGPGPSRWKKGSGMSGSKRTIG